jgi:asparagine synthase (glutamine-hydrolysing)
MCGICGVVQIGGMPRRVLEPGRLDVMTDVLRHRGPNDRGTYEEPGIALGVRRLSIVDVEGGHQPIANEDGSVWGIQNGELYNHLEVRRELERHGHRFTSRCDTEVIPHLYEHHGRGFPKRLRGKFGLAVWDGVRRRCVVARDRLGVKPLYYAISGDVLVFASELKSLLASGLIRPQLDLEAIDAYLTLGFVPAPHTPLLGVSKLLPGELLEVSPERVRSERYWRFPPPAEDDPPRSEEEYKGGLLQLLEQSVRMRLMSEVPLGAMLSGGLDSSLVVALMARNMAEPVKTFSVGFVEAGDSNELADAREVAAAFGTDHHELELSFVEQAVDLAELSWYLDEPLADLSALGFHALSELAARHVTVALSGQGADELLGGYSRHRNAVIAQRWDRVPHVLRSIGVGVAAQGTPRLKRAALVLGEKDAATRLLIMKSHIGARLRSRLVKEATHRDVARDVASGILNGFDGHLGSAALYLDSLLSLPDDMLHYFDRVSMAHSLEVRVPFLDHRLVEYCARIPHDLKVHGRTSKYILKEAARGIIPDRIIDKPKIGFFNPAVRAWFKAQAETSIADYLLADAPRISEFVDAGEVRRLVAAHLDGRDTTNSDALLTLLMLEVWLASYLPRAVGVPEPGRSDLTRADSTRSLSTTAR